MKANVKRILPFLLCIIFLSALCACSQTDFNDLVIYADDVKDAPEGEYTLAYSIKDYEKFSKNFNLTLNVRVFDENNAFVSVANNRTIKIEKNKIYTVNVICSATVGGEIKTVTKIYKVEAEKKQPELIFYVGSRVTERIQLSYGDSYDITAIAPPPDSYPEPSDGIITTIESKKWIVKINGGEVELSQEHLTNLTADLKIYASFEYDIKYTDVKIVFDNGEGSSTDTIEVLYNTTVTMPAAPTRAGYIFDGWYTEPEYKNIFNWTQTKRISLTKNYTLYAKWLEDKNSEKCAYYDFTMSTDRYGYDYYSIKFNASEVPDDGNILLPYGKNNVPVKSINTCFTNKDIITVIIPAHFDKGTYYAFNNCRNLTSVTFEEGSTLTYIDNYAFANCVSLTSVNLPDGIEYINESAFLNCSSLQSINMPSSLSRISLNAFKGCSGLVEINLPDGLTAIYQNAFTDCTSLRAVNLNPESRLDWISKGAFTNTAITEITLPYVFDKNDMNPFEGDDVKISYFPKLEAPEE